MTYTQMLNSRGGIECDFTVTRVRRGSLQDRHRDGVRPARPRLDPAARPRRRLRAGRRRDVATRVLRHLGPEGARDPAAADDDRPLERRVRLHASPGARGRAGAVPRTPRHVRRRARLGALLPRRSSGSRSGTRSGRRVASTGSSPVGTKRSTRCDWRRAIGYGARTSRRRTRRSRRDSGSPSSSTRATSSDARRLSAPASRSGSFAASRWTTRGPSRSARSRCGWATTLVGRVTSGGYGYTVGALDRIRVPTRGAGRGDRGGGRDLRRVGGRRRRRGAALRPAGERIRA